MYIHFFKEDVVIVLIAFLRFSSVRVSDLRAAEFLVSSCWTTGHASEVLLYRLYSLSLCFLESLLQSSGFQCGGRLVAGRPIGPFGLGSSFVFSLTFAAVFVSLAAECCDSPELSTSTSSDSSFKSF